MSKIHAALESIARRDVSDDTNLWPQIAARIEKKDKGMNPKFKLAWTVVLVLLALALATTAAYAVYRYFSDPGMKSVGDAGMIQDVNTTAQPTVLPPGTTPGPMIVSGETHTINGVTMTLDWVFAQSFDQAFHVSASGLAPDMRFGVPVVTYGGAPQENPNNGTIFSSNIDGDQTTGIYLVRQMMARETLDIVLDVPVLKQQTPIANFHFEIKNVPVYKSAGRDKSVYAFETGNAELTLKWLNMTPNDTIAHLCRDGDKNWSVGKATIQFGSTQDHSDISEVSANDLGRTMAEGNGSCIDLGFPLVNNASIRWLTLGVDDLTIAPDEKHSGPWHFEEDVPSLDWLGSQLQIPDLPTPTAAPQATVIPGTTPISQTDGAYTVTLLSAYADANRVVFTVHLDGWKNYSTEKGFYYEFGLTDPAGNEMDIPGSANNPTPDSHDMTFQFSPVISLKNERLTGKLNLSIQEDATNNSPIQAFHFEIDLPIYKAMVLTPRQSVSANGISMWLERVEISPSYTKLDLCYAKPTVGYWSITSPTLNAGSAQVSTDSIRTLILLDTDADPSLADPLDPGTIIRKEHQIEAPANIEIARCEQIGFPLGSQDHPKTLTLTIPELDFSPDDVSDADLKTAQAKLKSQGMEFTYDVISVQGNGFGGGGRNFVVQKKPASMSDDDVFRAFYDALGYYKIGPWSFTIQLTP